MWIISRAWQYFKSLVINLTVHGTKPLNCLNKFIAFFLASLSRQIVILLYCFRLCFCFVLKLVPRIATPVYISVAATAHAEGASSTITAWLDVPTVNKLVSPQATGLVKIFHDNRVVNRVGQCLGYSPGSLPGYLSEVINSVPSTFEAITFLVRPPSFAGCLVTIPQDHAFFIRDTEFLFAVTKWTINRFRFTVR